MTRRPRLRYRVEAGRCCIEIRLRSARQLFDLRDPAPFRERDLDPGAAEHLLTCIREIPRRDPVAVILHLPAEDPIEPEVLRDAIRGHFEHERDVVDAAIGENFRHGRRLFLLGLVVLAVFLTLAKVLAGWLAGTVVGEVVKEGFVITGWVAMWRPAEVLLYDWWPLYEQRGWIEKLLRSDVDVRRAQASVTPTPASTDRDTA